MHPDTPAGHATAARVLAAWRAYAALTDARAHREGRTRTALYVRAAARVAALAGIAGVVWAYIAGFAVVGMALGY